MSGKTISEKRIDKEMRPAISRHEKIYEIQFPDKAADAVFWKEIWDADDALAERLKPRPLSVMDVRKAISAYTLAFTRAAESGRARARNSTEALGTPPG